MKTTKIEWTDRTWNPVTGCTQKSEGCRNCYAKTMALRLQGMGQAKYKDGFKVTLQEDVLTEPKGWRQASMVFFCSMGDLFHEEVPFEYTDKVMNTIWETPRHTYQLLTKRPERMAEYFQNHYVPENAWLGTTVEAAEYKYRIDILRSIKGSFKFLSCEPLLGDLGELDLTGIDWVIVGGESGFKEVRPMKEKWAMNIKEQTDAQGVAFFFKQWGSYGRDGVWRRSKHDNGYLLNGKEYRTIPQR